MNELLFAVYFGGCVLLLYAQLSLVAREYRELSNRPPTFIDQLHLRLERYFGLSFRSKLIDWLHLDMWPASSLERRGPSRKADRMSISTDVALPAGTATDEIIVTHSFACGAGCSVTREVYAGGDCDIGPGSTIQAMAVDGTVAIGRGTRIVRWLDAKGNIRVEPGCCISGRITSAGQISLGRGVEFKSAFAALLVTPPGRDALSRPSRTASEHLVLDTTIDTWRRAGVNVARLRQLSVECMEYDGDLVLPTVRLRVCLVVKGSLKIGAGSHLQSDVKAVESMWIAPHSVCVGHLTAGEHIMLGMGTTFSGVIYAERSVRLDVGCRSEGAQVAVHGDATVTLADSVSIRGKVSAGGHVVTV